MDPDQTSDKSAAPTLSAALQEHIADTVRTAFPRPPGSSEEDCARRHHDAIARIAALGPANAYEVSMATSSVMCAAHAEECMRLSVEYAADPRMAAKLVAHSASMMREARAEEKLLKRLQVARRKRDADPIARKAAARLEQGILRQLQEAYDSLPRPGRPVSVPVAAAPPQPLVSQRARAERMERLRREVARFAEIDPPEVRVIH